MGVNFIDGFVNVLTGLGETFGKARGGSYAPPANDVTKWINAYRSSGLARRIVDIPAEDAFREWREWQAEKDQISAIEAEEKRLGVMHKLLEASRLARLTGGGGVYIGVVGDDPEEPLELDRVGLNGIDYLSALSIDHLQPYGMQQDVALPDFGGPLAYQVTGINNIAGARVHPTRIVPFYGNQIPRVLGNQGIWGDSVLATTLDGVAKVDGTAANVMELVYEGQVDILKIPEFARNLAEGGAQYESQVRSRLRAAKMGKDVTKILAMDTEEEYDQKTASFSGLDNILDRMVILCSANAGIPVTLLFGQSPSGLNATGESDVRAYYDRVKVYQTTVVTPAAHTLDEAIIRSAVGGRPPEIHYNWRSLWQPSASEVAEIGEKTANTFTALAGLNVLPPEAIGDAVVNALTEAGVAPGLEAAVEAYFGDPVGNPREPIDE